MNHSLDACLSVRVSDKTRTAFNRKAKRHGKSSDVLRQLVLAFIEDRITVKPNPVKGI